MLALLVVITEISCTCIESSKDMNVLPKLHTVLLPKLGVTKTFSAVMRSVTLFLGGLNLYLIEAKVIAQEIHYITLLCAEETLTKLLLKTIIEHY